MADVLAIADTSFSLASKAYNIARWLLTTTRKIKNAPEIWNNTSAEFMTDTKEKVDLLIEIVKNLASISSERDERIKDALNGMAKQLAADSYKLKERLDKTQPKTTRLRIDYALRSENSLNELISQIQTRAGHLLTWLHLVDLSRSLRATKEGNALDEEVLACRPHQEESIQNAHLLSTRSAQYKPFRTEDKENIVLLADRFESTNAIKTVAGFLSQRIGNAGGGFAEGILPCLGYKKDQLMFRLPYNADAPKTLQTRVSDDAADGQVASLGQRFDLARQLAEAVFMLHSAKIVHKNLRGDTLLLLQPRKDMEIPKKAVVLNVSNGYEESQPTGEDRKLGKPVKGETGLTRQQRRADSPRSIKVSNQGKNNASGNGDMDSKVIDDRIGRSVKREESSSSLKERAKKRVRSWSRRREKSRSPADGGIEPKTIEESPSPRPPGRLRQWLPPDSTVAILTHWQEAKRYGEVSDGSLLSGDQWHIQVYRHPSQQASIPRTEYNFGHDIYALGTCLLEIGLWDTLVRPGKTASTRLLSVGGVATVNLLKMKLMEAFEEVGSGANATVLAALEDTVVAALDDANIASVSRLSETLDGLELSSSREASRTVVEQIRPKIEQALIKDHYHGISYRLRGALVEIVMDKALGEKGDGSATLVTAQQLKQAVKGVLYSKRSKTNITATANRLEAAVEAAVEAAFKEVDIEEIVVAEVKKVMHSAVEEVVKDRAEVLDVARKLERKIFKLKDKMERQKNNSSIGDAIAREVKVIQKTSNYVTTVDELQSLLNDQGGGEAMRCALVSLAEQQLPAIMGVDYAGLVVKCLKVHEKSFGEKFNYEELNEKDTRILEDACIDLETQVVASLRRVRLG